MLAPASPYSRGVGLGAGAERVDDDDEGAAAVRGWPVHPGAMLAQAPAAWTRAPVTARRPAAPGAEACCASGLRAQRRAEAQPVERDRQVALPARARAACPSSR